MEENPTVKSRTEREKSSTKVSNSSKMVPSALTIENLKIHEEGSDAINVVELMTKNTCKAIGPEILRTNNQEMQLSGDIWSQPKKRMVEPTVSPAVKEEVRGWKFSGEEFLAISVDVQTDESYLAQAYQYDLTETDLDNDIYDVHSRTACSANKSLEENWSASLTSQQKTAELSKVDNADGECGIQSQPCGILVDQVMTNVNTEESEAVEDGFVKHITESRSNAFEAGVQTLKCIGPPLILQYKPESEAVQLKYSEVDLSIPGNLNLREVTIKQADYYDIVMKDMKQLREEKTTMLGQRKQLISIEPHSAFGSLQQKKVTKDHEREQNVMKDLKKQPKQVTGVAGQAIANQTNFYAFARQLKTVNYSLSSEKCMDEGWTIRPVTPSAPKDPTREIFVPDDDLQIDNRKKCHHVFVKKLYTAGSTFMIIFPDRSGNVWYPSGFLAFSIVSSGDLGKLTFIVHEDKHPSEGGNIQAIFQPNGYCTCYYASGVIRLSLTPLGGEYYSPRGERLKNWLWRDTHTHVHAPPFQPITFSLSRRIGVRIISQESIFITFTDGGRSVRFNAGTRLKLKASSLPKLYPVDADKVVLKEKRLHVLGIIEKMQNSMKFSKSPRWERIQLSNYLNAQFGKNEEACNHPKYQKNRKIGRDNTSTYIKSCQKLPMIRFKNENVPTPMKTKAYQESEGSQPVVIVN